MKATAAILSPDFLSAKEALRMLDVLPQTLYAYVSRGRIRSVRATGRRERLYLREDVEKMRARSAARAGHGVVAASAMSWGDPIIPTSITEITADGPRYRGHLAVQLARSGTSFESVAELLWSGLWHETPLRWPVVALPAPVRQLARTVTDLKSNDQLLEVLALVTLKLGLSRGSIAERMRGGQTHDAARQIIQTLTGCFGYVSRHRRYVAMRPGQGIVDGLLSALAIEDSAQNRHAIEAMLIVFADHELSPGAFAARVAASSGSTLHSCIASAICTSSGVKIGRLYDRVEEFLAGGATRATLLRRAEQLQDRGITVPGFVHPIYPKGDPRGLFLLDVVKRSMRPSKRTDAICNFVDDARDKLAITPRHELAVVTLAISMGLPPRTAGAIFTLSRTAGWIAHVLEQRLSVMLLRPRAKFVAS